MKDDKFFFDYKKEPGLKLDIQAENFNNIKPLVSIITSYYNSDEFLWQTFNCVLNQTFPYWEWIIVDDGSTSKKSLEVLEEFAKKDSRIKVYNKENEGLAKGRDYAISKATTDLILPLDADDLIEKTYIETLYFTLKVNKNASWAFTNSLGFGKYIYLVDQNFDSNKMKTENQITATALIRKEKILELGGYGQAKRYVNEDWHLWLRMLAKENFPVQVTYYGFWYRRRKESLLSEINDEKKEENKLRLRDLKIEADKITKKVNAKIYPIPEEVAKEVDIKEDEIFDKKTTKDSGILYILPQTGPDKKLYKEIKNRKGKKYIITIKNENYSSYIFRQKYEKFATVYDLTSFLDKQYYEDFVKYIIYSKNINKIFIADGINRSIDKCEVSKVKYRPSNKYYKLQILKYKIKYSLLGRGVRKLYRMLKKS